MGFKQKISFDPSKMGTRKGYCLQNVAKGYGIYPSPDPSASAKQDMERNAAKGTLHRDSNFPLNCAVPVYLDTASKWEHIIVADHGVYWSDGKRLTSLAGLKVLGWGEWCNGYQIVVSTPDPVPPTPSGFLPAKGYWCKGDKDPRIAQEASFMRKTFPAYTPAAALGPIYGPALCKSVAEFQRRVGLVPDSMTGPLTYEKMRQYGFRPNC